LGEEGKEIVPTLVKIIQSDKWFAVAAERDGMIFHGYTSNTSGRLESISSLGAHRQIRLIRFAAFANNRRHKRRKGFLEYTSSKFFRRSTRSNQTNHRHMIILSLAKLHPQGSFILRARAQGGKLK